MSNLNCEGMGLFLNWKNNVYEFLLYLGVDFFFKIGRVGNLLTNMNFLIFFISHITDRSP